MYKIAVFSDIHGNEEALDAILRDIKKGIFDEVICLGDIINIGPNSKECLNKIADSDIKLLLGNHELYFIKGLEDFEIENDKIEHYNWVFNQLSEEEKKKIAKKPLSLSLKIKNHTFRFNHYFIKDEQAKYPFYGINTIKRSKIDDLINLNEEEYVFYGHDHIPSRYKFNDKYFINVGSSGCVKDEVTFYTVIEIDENVNIYKKNVPFNRKKFESKLYKTDYPSVDFINKNYFDIEKTD